VGLFNKLVYQAGRRFTFLSGIITHFFPGQFCRGLYEISGKPGFDYSVGGKIPFTVSFDCDREEDAEALPGIVEILKKTSMHASFGCIGKLIEMFPAEHKCIIENGHEIFNHGYLLHSSGEGENIKSIHFFHDLNPEQQGEDIDNFDRCCGKVLNYKPAGFRTPHFSAYRGKDFYSLLESRGYIYSSSTFSLYASSGVAPYLAARGIREFPVSLCPEHPFVAFDSGHSDSPLGKYHSGAGALLEIWKRLLLYGECYKAYTNVYFDPSFMVNNPGFYDCMQYLRDSKKFKALTYKEFAEKLINKENQ
jgi:hypothetical protein